MKKLKEKLKRKENIIKLILIINVILMAINITKLIIEKITESSNLIYVSWVLITVLVVLNILLIIKTNQNNYKRNFILMICLIILNFVIPVSNNQTYQQYKRFEEDSQGRTYEELSADGGVYRVEHYSDIYGIDIFQLNHKPSKDVEDVN